MNKAIAFILGLVLGGVFFLGAIGMAAYAGLVMVHPEDVLPDSKTYIGDLAGMSIYDMFVAISDLYKTKLGVTGEDGKYYTIGEFCQTYNIDTETAFGIKLEGDVADIPMMEFLSKEANADGDNGFQRTLKQIKLSAVTAVVNMFGGTDEDGNPKEVVSASAVEKLNNHSLYDLIMDESVGIAGCFADVEFAEVMPSAFPSDETTDNKLMFALGKTKIGKMLEALSGDNNLFLLMKEGGALETLGNLSFTDILGDESELITSLLGGRTINSLISDTGSIVPDELLDDIKLGNVLSLTYDEESGVWTDTDGNPADGFFATIADLTINQVRDTTVLSSFDLGGLFGFVKNPVGEIGTTETPLAASQTDSTTVAYLRQAGGQYALCSAVDFENDKAKWYEANLVCDGSHENHTAECFEYVWYGQACENAEHVSESDHVAAGEVLIGNTYHGKPTGVFAALIGLTVGDLTSGNSDKIMAKIGDLRIGDLLTTDGETADLIAALADMTINDLLSDGLNTIRFGMIFGLKRIETTIPQTTAQHTLYKAATAAEGEKPLYLVTFDDSEGKLTRALSEDGNTFYLAELTCTTEGCEHNLKGCYKFAWYTLCQNSDHTDCIEEIVVGDKRYVPAEGISAKLADLTIDSLSDINAIIGDITLRDVLTTIPTMLNSLADVPVSKIADELGKVHIGSMLGYERAEFVGDKTKTTTVTDGIWSVTDGTTTTTLKADGDKLYAAALNCKDDTHEATHTADCYTFVWYKVCAEGCSESHDHFATGTDYKFATDGLHTATDGIEGLLSDKTINDLSNLNDILANDVTLGAVLGDNLPQMLAPLADVTVANMGDAVNKLCLGGILGLYRQDVDQSTKIDELDGGKVIRTSDGYAVKEGKMYYLAELTCTDTTHAHTAECFAYVWFTKCQEGSHEGGATHTVLGEQCQLRTIDGVADNFYRTSGITGKLAAKTVGGLTDVSDIINSATLYDVLGDNVPSMLDSIKYEPIGNLQNALDKLYLGDVLGYVKAQVDASDYTDLFDTVKQSADDKIAIKCGNVWAEGKVDCDQSHTHTADCYGYVWYQECQSGHAHTADCVSITTTDGKTIYAQIAGGVTGKLAGEKVSQLGSGLNDKLMSFTLADVLGDNVPTMLQSIADTKISELGTAINSITIGELLGNKQQGGVWYEKCTKTDHSTCTDEIDSDGEKYVPASGILAKLCPLTVGELNSDTIQSVIDDVTLGEVIQIDDSSNKILQKFRDKKIGELAGEFDNLTLGDVLDTTAPGTNGLIVELADCKIGEIGTKINDVKLGAALGYARTEAAQGTTLTQLAGTTVFDGSDGKTYILDGGKYYLAELTCTDAAHTHTDDCYAAVWTTTDGSAATGMNKIIADMTVTELSDSAKLKAQINKLTLADVMDNTDDNSILKALADKPIGELASSMNEMSMGIVLGYTKDGDVWKDGEGNEVKGINAKIADKTLADIGSGNGVNDIMAKLTMGDLVDSGVLTISAEDTYKMAIIANGLTQGYLWAKTDPNNIGTTVTPQSYYLTQDPDESDLYEWKSMKIDELIQQILGVL